MSAESPVVLDKNEPLTEAVPVRKTRLQRLRWPLMSLAAIAVLGGGAYFYIKGSRYQSTDDAYAQAATVSISANVGGRVSEIEVRDNELVQRGATLFKLDDTPFRIAVSDAVAHLADTRQHIESPTFSSRSAWPSPTWEVSPTLPPNGILWSRRRRPPLIVRNSTYPMP